jgi:hypothetical protein
VPQGNLASNVIDVMVFCGQILNVFLFLARLCRRHVVGYFDEDRRKCDYARSISRKTRRCLDWFRYSQRVTIIHALSVYYAVEKFVTPDKLRATTYIVKRIVL